MNVVHPLRTKRVQAGFTQQQLAARAGIATHTVLRIENRYAQPRRSTLAVLAMALNTVPAALSD